MSEAFSCIPFYILYLYISHHCARHVTEEAIKWRVCRDLSFCTPKTIVMPCFKNKINLVNYMGHFWQYRGADKSLARPGRKKARKHVRDARDFNNIETRAVIKFFFLQAKAPKEIHAILTETLTYFLPGRAKDLWAPVRNNSDKRLWTS